MARSISADAFAAAMAAFAPYEPEPRLALAVSGGADSMALAVLAHGWAASRGGRARALIVDHRLRPGSGEEAAVAAARCRTFGLDAEVLVREGEAPASAIEERAREARYHLLREACRRHGALHLLTAHHADDQDETVHMRRERGSGAAGLAGMSACRESGGLRLLRPLLAWPKARLAATARAAGLDWVDDPMNRDPRFARARLRARGAAPNAAADSNARCALEARLTAVLPALATLDRFGVGRMDRAAWQGLDAGLRLPVLGRLALAVGGGAYSPGSARLERLAWRLDGKGVATLGGCLWRTRTREIVIEREGRNLPAAMDLEPGVERSWDGRFAVCSAVAGVTVGALGRDDASLLAAQRRLLGLSAAAAAALPAFRDLEGLLAVPHLDYARPGRDLAAVARFRPRHSLSPVPFVAPPTGSGESDQRRGALVRAC